MAITSSGIPTRLISTEPTYNYSTDLVEGASYQNVRIRCTIYHLGEVVAVIEQPKGLIEFNLKDILNSLCGKLQFDFKSSTKVITPISSGTNLFSGAWVNTTSFASFTSANELAVSGTVNVGNDGWARSAAISLTKGDIIAICFTLASSNAATVLFQVTNNIVEAAGTRYDLVSKNSYSSDKMLYLSVNEDVATAYIWIRVVMNTGAFNFGLRTFKISAAQMRTFNNPVAYYRAVFTEYYENSSNVTTAGASATPPTYLFIPAKESQANLIANKHYLDSNTSRFLSKSIGLLNATKNFTYNKSHCHIRVLGITSYAYSPAIYRSNDGGAGADDPTFYHGGWFFVNLESESYLSALTSKISFYYRTESTQYSASHEIELTSKCTPFPVQIEFKGIYGNEFIVLAGRKVKSILNLFKEKFTNKYGLKLPFGSQIMNSIEVESNFQKEEYFQLLGELINTDKTPELILEANTDYDFDYCAPCEVEEDEIIIDSENEMVNAKIKVNYYPYNL